MLAHDAKIALERVERGEDDTMAGWLAYGAALNEGREQFSADDDYNFGKWKQENVYDNLSESFPHPNKHEEAAAMWAARDPNLIRARAEMRLAEEYDAAQDRGEVAGHGRSKVEADNVTTAADIGLRRDEIQQTPVK